MLTLNMPFRFTCLLLWSFLLLPPLLAQSDYADYQSSDKEVFYLQEFNAGKDSLWTTTEDRNRRFTMKSGRYRLEAKRDIPKISFAKIPFDISKDYEIETSIRIIKSYEDDKGFLNNGFFWGMERWGEDSGDYNLYMVFFRPNRVKISKFAGGKYKDYLGHTTPGAYFPDEFNKITIRKVNRRYYFFYNEQLLHEMPEYPYFGDTMGFMVTQFSTLEVDYLRINYLPTRETPAAGEARPEAVAPANEQSQLNNTTADTTGQQDVSRGFLPDHPLGIALADDSSGQAAMVREEVRPEPVSTQAEAPMDSSAAVTPANNQSSVVAAGVDSTALLIEISKPEISRGAMPLSLGTQMTVAGRAVSSVPIDRVVINEIDASLDSKEGRFMLNVPLQPGQNTITIQAFDASGKSSHKVFSVNRETKRQRKPRLALVVGNSAYTGTTPLANSANDAEAMAGVLEQLGFDVEKHLNLDYKQLRIVVDQFGKRLKDYETGLFFYAGHGLQVMGYNYLVPVDAELSSEEDVEYNCVKMGRVLARMENAETSTNIIILDACRNNPFASSRSWDSGGSGQGLAFMNAPGGSLIAYSTAPGKTASDGTGSNGLYTAALLKAIDAPETTILKMFQNVRSKVIQLSERKQIPWESTSLLGDFYFYPVAAEKREEPQQ